MAVCKRVNEHILLKTVYSLHFELFFYLVLFPQMLMCEEVIEDKNKKLSTIYSSKRKNTGRQKYFRYLKVFDM